MISAQRIQQIAEEARKRHAERQAATGVATSSHIGRVFTDARTFAPTIKGFEYNEQQLNAIELAIQSKSFCLIGAAGTGKTTTTREVVGQLCKLPHINPISRSTKYLSRAEPGIAIISFTNKAVNNIKKFLPPELQRHCLTYHKLLEYRPNSFELENGKTSKRFEPTYDANNKLPHISCIIVEESSMVDAINLHPALLSALPHPEKTQWIFLGDLNQLPPIFGPSILGFKLLELPVVELTHVYRQALESPIITLAHKIREGKGVGHLHHSSKDSNVCSVDDRGEHGKVTLYGWRNKVDPINAIKNVQHMFGKLIDAGAYDPEKDAILCPFNKKVGTLELNRYIVDKLGKQRGETVFEVIARGTRSYWAVGDRVLVDRQEGKIIGIEPLLGYGGRLPRNPSKTLDRWGHDPENLSYVPSEEINEESTWDILDKLEVGGDEDDEETNDASHAIRVLLTDSQQEVELKTAGGINSMLFSYVLTVHKSQGSEWGKVFIVLHYSHNTMLSRELLYTAITRAKHELFIILEPDRKNSWNSLNRAAESPEIKGVTIAEKAEWFKQKRKEMKKLGEGA